MFKVATHKQTRMFRWKIYGFLILMTTMDFIFTIAFGVSVEFYLPFRPFLLIYRYKRCFLASDSLRSSTLRALDIFLLYACCVYVCGVVGMSLYSTVINADERNNSYTNILRSLTTTFVYVTTGENYPDIVYPALDKNDFNLVYFMIVLVLGMFGLIPIIIHS
eukprot:UN23619